MNNILVALYSKFTGSTLSTYVGGRIYFPKAPIPTPAYPHVVYSMETVTPEKTFSDRLYTIRFTFSLYSRLISVSELTTMHGYLRSLLDECSLTITSNKLVSMEEVCIVPTTEFETTSTGEDVINVWNVDYDMEVCTDGS